MAKIKKDTSLRKAILQAAITGQLISDVESASFENQNSVSERSERQTGKQLLDRIIEERNAKLLAEWEEALKKNPKAKKPTPVVASEISEDEIPFEIPENWCWCRLSDYLDIRDGTHDSPKFYNEGIPFVTSKNLNDGKLDFKECKYITEEDHKKFSARSFVDNEDILFAMIGSIGNPVIVKKEFDFSFKNMALFKRYSKDNTDMKYIYHYLCHIQRELKEIATGGVQSFIGLGTFRDMLFPLPPLAVQNAIVAKLEQVLPLVDVYENAVLQKEELKAALPDKVKKAILQVAITGKLTEDWRKRQRLLSNAEATETGKQLLDLIITARNAKALAEWEEKIKTNPKAKKPTPIVASEIEEDEISFEIPESWCWCRLGEICSKLVDGDHNPPAGLPTKTDYIMASSQNINNDSLVDLEKVRYLSKEVFEEENERTKATKGDIFFTSVGTLGRSCIYDGSQNICFQRSVSVLTTVIYNKFLKYALDAPFVQYFIVDNATGTAQKGFYLNQLAKLVLPLPPLEEQEEIVELVEELLPLCS